jgi:hypothetical protein
MRESAIPSRRPRILLKPAGRGGRISFVESAPERLHPGFIAAGYAAVSLVAAILLYNQYLQHLRELQVMATMGPPLFHPYSDWLLALLIGGLFLIPTVLLVLTIRESETAYTIYSRILLLLSITLPVCLLLTPLLPVLGIDFLFVLCLFRFYVSPAVAVGLAISWFFGRFAWAKRLIRYALMIEVGTLVVGMVFIAFMLKALSGLH